MTFLLLRSRVRDIHIIRVRWTRFKDDVFISIFVKEIDMIGSWNQSSWYLYDESSAYERFKDDVFISIFVNEIYMIGSWSQSSWHLYDESSWQLYEKSSWHLYDKSSTYERFKDDVFLSIFVKEIDRIGSWSQSSWHLYDESSWQLYDKSSTYKRFKNDVFLWIFMHEICVIGFLKYTTDGGDRTQNSVDCQNFQQVLTGVPIHIKHIFTGVLTLSYNFSRV